MANIICRENILTEDPDVLTVKDVQLAEWLGHSSSTTTLSFYSHIDKTSKMTIANALDGVK